MSLYVMLRLVYSRPLISSLEPPEGGRGIELGRLVSPPAGNIPAKGASVSSSGMYKYSNTPSRRFAGKRKGTRYLRPGGTVCGGCLNSQSVLMETLKTLSF